MNQSKKKVFSCVACRETKYKQRQGHARDNKELVPFECINCGLVTLSGTDHIKDDFYAEGHMYDDNSVSIDLIIKQDEKDSKRRIEQFFPYIKAKSVLDIGCGAGGFLLQARPHAKESLGIELNRTFEEHYKKNDIMVFESLDLLPKEFIPDTIFLFHVFEHIADPYSFLRKLYEYCGRFNHKINLIIEVPHANDALLTYYNSKAFSKFTYWSCHLYLHTANSLQNVLEASGFTSEKIIYYQRYPLSNHLYWLSNNQAGGQHYYTIFNDEQLMKSYSYVLEKERLTDTLIGYFKI